MVFLGIAERAKPAQCGTTARSTRQAVRQPPRSLSPVTMTMPLWYNKEALHLSLRTTLVHPPPALRLRLCPLEWLAETLAFPQRLLEAAPRWTLCRGWYRLAAEQ